MGEIQAIDSDTERLVESYRPALVALAGRVVSSDAEDVVQEAILRLAGDPVRGRPGVEVTAWLRRVCLNLAFNRRRDLERWRDRAIRGGTDERGWSPDEPESAALRAEEQEHVRAVLGRLTDRHRIVLVLRYSGYSYAEIAASLEIPVSSVGTNLARAERAFRSTYEEYEHEHMS
jgi:RNA polymerase sigma factor (sigma-70 family)